MQTYGVMYGTHSQVIISAGSAGLQVEVRERELELVSLAGSDGPVALGIGVVGQRVVGGRKSPRCSCQSPTTSFNVETQLTVYVSFVTGLRADLKLTYSAPFLQVDVVH